MNPLSLPWLEWSILVALVGSVWVRLRREPGAAARAGMAFTGAAFGCAFLAWLGFYLGAPPGWESRWSVQARLFGGPVLALDELSAPLVPSVALLHFLMALTTTRTKMRSFSFSWSLAADALRLATFSCGASWPLVAL